MDTFAEKVRKMAFRNKEFSCSIPDISLATTEKMRVLMEIDGSAVYDEWLYPAGGLITLQDLSGLVSPYVRKRQTVEFAVTVTDEYGDERLSERTEVVYCQADFGEETADHFLQTHFLSILMGDKVTSVGRLEYLHMQGNDEANCMAYYKDGTSQSFSVGSIQSGAYYRTLDVSPSLFMQDGKTLKSYVITAGSRTQRFEVDDECADCAPILIFVNSFGLDELAYCTGLHRVQPGYKRNSAYFSGVQKNYKIDETRAFQADTGPLTIAMANWWDEVFRSDSVRIVNFYEGNPNVGKDLLITDSKSEYTNDDAEIPRFTFTYQYAQRNHNVVQLLRAGRIFDNTFDNTFN